MNYATNVVIFADIGKKIEGKWFMATFAVGCCVWLREGLEEGGELGVEVTAEGDEQPDHQGDENEQQDERYGRLQRALIDLLDDGFVAIDKALNHLHVLPVGAMEDIDDVADKEGYHAKQHVTQGVVEDGECEGNAFDDLHREIDKRYGTEDRDDVAPTGDET